MFPRKNDLNLTSTEFEITGHRYDKYVNEWGIAGKSKELYLNVVAEINSPLSAACMKVKDSWFLPKECKADFLRRNQLKKKWESEVKNMFYSGELFDISGQIDSGNHSLEVSINESPKVNLFITSSIYLRSKDAT